jgi:hypothetical protein
MKRCLRRSQKPCALFPLPPSPTGEGGYIKFVGSAIVCHCVSEACVKREARMLPYGRNDIYLTGHHIISSSLIHVREAEIP